MTELYDAQRKLEEAKVGSAKLFAEACKSLAKLHSEDSLERMTYAVQTVGLESLWRRTHVFGHCRYDCQIGENDETR